MLIDKITVLNNYYQTYDIQITCSTLLFILGIICAILGIYIISQMYDEFFGWILGIFLIVVGILFCRGSTNLIKYYVNEEKENPIIIYQVTIDDSVFLNEFYDKYEILKKEGDIYTIKERENNNG